MQNLSIVLMRVFPALLVGAIQLSLISNAAAQNEIDFVEQVKPILESHCLECHGEIEKDGEENDFRISDRDDALDFIGSDGVEDSDLFLLIISDDDEEVMPPAEHSKLTESQIEILRAWIDQGASWPDDVELVLSSGSTSVSEPEVPPTDPGEEPTSEGQGNLAGGVGTTSDEQAVSETETKGATDSAKQTQQLYNAVSGRC